MHTAHTPTPHTAPAWVDYLTWCTRTLALGALALAVVACAWPAPSGGYVGTDRQAHDRFAGVPVNVPTWDTATPTQRAGCWRVGQSDAIPSQLLTADRDGTVTRRPFNAHTVHTIRTTPHLYVIGACR